MAKATEVIAVLVCTDCRGVFFGYLDPKEERSKVVALKRARNAYYWSPGAGVLSLANYGPREGSKIGSRADIVLQGVTLVARCTKAAVSAWEEVPDWVR